MRAGELVRLVEAASWACNVRELAGSSGCTDVGARAHEQFGVGSPVTMEWKEHLVVNTFVEGAKWANTSHDVSYDSTSDPES